RRVGEGLTVTAENLEAAHASISVDALRTLSLLREGPPSQRLTSREVEILRMVAIVSTTTGGGEVNFVKELQGEDWAVYAAEFCPSVSGLGPSDDQALQLVQDVGLLPTRTDHRGLSPIARLMPLNRGDALYTILGALGLSVE